MQNVNDMWLRGRAAQQSMLQLAAYNVAFMGNAAVQSMRLGLNVPVNFWAAMGRAGGGAESGDAERVTRPAPVAPAAVAMMAEAIEMAEADAAPQEFLLDAPRGGTADPLTELKGVGEKLAAALNDFGIYHFDQIAALTADQIAWLDENQRGFRMVLGRYDLIGQAKERA